MTSYIPSVSFFLTEETASFRLLHLADVTIISFFFPFFACCNISFNIVSCLTDVVMSYNVAHEVVTSEFIILVDMKKNCLPSATRRKEARYLW